MEEQGRQKARERGNRIDKLKARWRRKVCDKGKKERESHWERWKIKKEGDGSKQRRPLRSQARKSRGNELFAQNVQFLTSV